MKKLPSKLYHYCSVESLFNIINSKSLWLSNSGQMNDSKESTWIEEHFSSLEHIFLKNNEIRFLNDTLDIYRLNKITSHIYCLSENRDSLSQWRAYSSDGVGVCIGYSTMHLGIEQELPSITSNCNTLSLLPVVYNTRKQLKELTEKSKSYKNWIEDDQESFYPHIVSFYSTAIRNMSLTFKNPCFSEEQEWRIIFASTSTGMKHTLLRNDDDFEPSIDNNISEHKFRVSNDKIISYHEYSLKKIFNSMLIPEIVLGPKSNIDIPELEMFLKANGLENTKIIRSESTYR